MGAFTHAEEAGRAYVFTETPTGWKQVAELKGSDTIAGDQFGFSVAISGTTVVVGSPIRANNAGSAYVFNKSATGWKQVAELKGSDTVAEDYFGSSAAISGTTVVVGAEWHANGAGRAYVFTRTLTGWKQAAELKGSDTVASSDFRDNFGGAVAVSDGTVVVGASHHANSAGRAYVFTRTLTGWKQAAELKGSGTVSGDLFGSSVAISGTTAVVGAEENYKSVGRAYVFSA